MSARISLKRSTLPAFIAATKLPCTCTAEKSSMDNGVGLPRAAPALAFIQLAHQAACQGVGGARRNDERSAKGRHPTLINALVNGEVAP
jgi:hypothetical protein